jgi:capsular exopolysaccharide synthesis family protein
METLSAFLKKRLPVMLPIVMLSTVLSTWSAFREVDVYAAAAKVELAQEPLDPTTARYTMYTDSSLPVDFVNTEIFLLKSRLLASIVVERHEDVRAALAENGGDPVSAFEGSVYVRPVRDTRLVEVGCESSNPRQCALFANALARTYCDYKTEERAKLTSENLGALAKQIPEVKAKIEKTQLELSKFVTDEGTVEHEQELVLDRLKAYNEALNQAQRERIRADADIEVIQQVELKNSSIDSAPSIASSGNVQRLRAELATAEIDLAQLLVRYREDCPLPKVRSLRGRCDDLRLELKSEVDTIKKGMLAYRDTKLAEEKGLREVVTQLRDEVRKLGQQSQRFVILQKNVENNERLYEELIRRSGDLALYRQVETSSVKIIDNARDPGGPIRPNRPKTIALGVIFGSALALALAYMLERLDSRFRSADDVRVHLHAEVLALIPEVRGVASPELERLALTVPESPFAESFRRLRAQLHASAPAHVVLVTSGAPTEGKTASAINLAIATANSGGRVVLIDADMRNPCVHKAFHLELQPGLADCLSDQGRNPAELIHATEVPNLFVLTAGQPPRNAAELLAIGGRFEKVMAVLRQKFERIVIDTPPAAFLSDAAIMAPSADTTVLIVSTKHSRRRATRLAHASLAGVGSKPLGVILNHMGDRELRDLYYQYYYPRAGGVPGESKGRSPVRTDEPV